MSTLVGYVLPRGVFGVFDSTLCAITFFDGTEPEASNGQERLCCPLGGLKEHRFCFILPACETAIMERQRDESDHVVRRSKNRIDQWQSNKFSTESGVQSFLRTISFSFDVALSLRNLLMKKKRKKILTT